VSAAAIALALLLWPAPGVAHQAKEGGRLAKIGPAPDHERKQITQAGFDGYQTKPIHVKVFLAAVTALLARDPPK
jgi:hypothetical protein